MARIPPDELERLLRGHGTRPQDRAAAVPGLVRGASAAGAQGHHQADPGALSAAFILLPQGGWETDDLRDPVRVPGPLEDVLQVAREREPHPLQPGLGADAPEAPQTPAARDLIRPGGRGDPARGRADHGAGPA